MRARELLDTVWHAAMATVNEDGSPHNTPYFFACDASLKHLYWASRPEAQHSRNIMRAGQVFVVLYDAFERGGLYIRADDAHVAKGDELETALAIFNTRRAAAGREGELRSYYEADGPERLYVATVRRLWVIAHDLRHEIRREDLLAESPDN